ncbi:hypothetical protein IFR05_013231 [Cadophora sp. M221]|nr:hypothetical protein IFR05_013231 [Cadophora sp. M221]
MAELHVFDPEGDVLLILERYQEDDLEERTPSPPPSPDAPDWPKPEPDPSPPLSADAPDWPEPQSEPVRYESEAETAGAEVDGLTKPATSTSTCLARRESKPRAEKVQMRVSSKHLILASPTFRTSLGSDTYPEGRTLQNEGSLAIPLPDEDPDAMIILLNIIHGLSSKVPRQVDLNMLSKIAVTVNHRHIHEAVGIWSDTWIGNLKRVEGLPRSYTPDTLLPWLFISWVFRKHEDFRKMAQILEQESDSILETEVDAVYIGPYIPASIILIHNLITKYSGPKILCDKGHGFSCDAKLLGSLLKASAMIGIWPRPEDPYPGINSKTLASQIRGMQVMDDCSRYYSHEIKVLIEASMESLEDDIPVLRLDSFLPQAGKEGKKGTKGGKNKKGKPE